MGVGAAWGTREEWKEWLHPRGYHGRFKNKGILSSLANAIEKLAQQMDKFNPRTFQSQGQANDYVFNLSQKAHGKIDATRFVHEFDHVNDALRAGQMDPSTKKYVDMMDAGSVTLPQDTILSRVVGADAFGLDAQSMHDKDNGIQSMVGRLFADKGYTMSNIGPEKPNKKPGQITMRVAVPAGTKVNLRPGQRDGGVTLPRDQELRITKVNPDGVGGYYVMAVATEKTPGLNPEPFGGAEKPNITPSAREARLQEIRKTPRPYAPKSEEGAGRTPQEARQAAQQSVLNPPETQTTRHERSARLGTPEPSPTGPTNTGANGPAPRQEPIAHPSIGTAGGGATRQPTTPEAAPEHAPVQPQSLDFRRAARNANLEPPSNGPRRKEWRNAYEGVANGKKNPEDVLRELEKDIDVNEAKLHGMEQRGENIQQADPLLRHDIQRQRDLADLIRREHGLGPRPKREAAAPVKKAAKKAAAPRASVTNISEAPSKRAVTKAARPRGAMTLTEAKRRTAMDAMKQNEISGDGAAVHAHISNDLASGKLTPTQARSAALKAEKEFKASATEARKADNDKLADQHLATADKFRNLAEKLHESGSVVHTDKYRNAPQGPAPVKTATKVAKKAAPSAPSAPRAAPTGEDLDNMTANELRALAKSEGVSNYSKYNKDRLKEAIRAKREGRALPAPISGPLPAKKAVAKAAPKSVGEEDIKPIGDEAILAKAEKLRGKENLDPVQKLTVQRADRILAERQKAGVPKKPVEVAPTAVKKAEAAKAAVVNRNTAGSPESIKENLTTTIPNLRQIAKDEGVDLKGKTLKKDIIQAIRDKRAGKVPEPAKRAVKAVPSPEAAKKAAKANPVKKAAAAAPIKAPDRKADFTDDFKKANIQVPDSAAGRTMEEIRDDVAVGHITPNEGIRRLENDIQLNKTDLADLKAEYRQLGNIHEIPVREAEQKRLNAEAKRLREDIAAQEKMATFMHGHFQKAPEVTPDELKAELTPEQLKALENATPDSLKRAAKIAGLDLGDIKGDTKEEVWNNMVKAMARQELKRRGLPDVPQKLVEPKAPDVPKPDIAESPYKRIDINALAEGLDIHADDKGILKDVQDLLDGKSDRLGKNPTPAKIADDIDQFLKGPGSPFMKAIVARELIGEKKPWETEQQFESRRKGGLKEAENLSARGTELARLSARLRQTRRVRKEHAPEVRTSEPKLAAPERADIAKVAEATGIPAPQLEKKALAKKVAEAPPKASAQQVAETIKTVGSGDEINQILNKRTKADIREVGKALGMDIPTSKSKVEMINMIRNRQSPTVSHFRRGELMQMEPSELRQIEDDLGITKRPSLAKEDRVDAILQAQEATGAAPGNVAPTVTKVEPTTRSKAVIPEAQTKIATQERKDGIQAIGEDLRKLTGDQASKTALTKFLDNRLRSLEQTMGNKQVREDVQPVLDAVKAGDNDRALRLMGEIENVHGIKAPAKKAAPNIAKDLKALEAEAATAAKKATPAKRVPAPKPTGSVTAGRIKEGDTVSLKAPYKYWRDPQKVTKVERVTIPRQGGKSSQSGIRITRADGSTKEFTSHHAFHQYGGEAPEPPPVKKAVKTAPAKAAAPSVGTATGELSDKPLIPNTYDKGGGGPVNFHGDGNVGMALSRMTEDQKRLSIDGEPLANVLGKLVTDNSHNKISTEDLLHQLRALQNRIRDEKIRNLIGQAADDINAPKVDFHIPEGTPAPLKDLMEALARNPLARKGGRLGRDKSLVARLQDVINEVMGGGDFSRYDILSKVRHLADFNHESEEGFYEMRRDVLRYAEELRKNIRLLKPNRG